MIKRIIAIVLILAVVLVPALIEENRIRKYENAIELYVEQSYEEAGEMFDKLDSYRKSAYYFDKIKVSEIEEAVITGDYEKIFANLESVKSEEIRSSEIYGDYMLTAKIMYIEANPDMEDSRTAAYVNELKEAEMWSSKLDSLMNPWIVDVFAVNTREGDVFTNYAQVDRKEPFYIHAIYSGGGDRNATNVRAEITHPTGKVEYLNINGSIGDGSVFWIYMDSYRRNLSNGELKVAFFDSDDNEIGQTTLKMGESAIVGEKCTGTMNYGIEESSARREMLNYLGMTVADVKKALGSSFTTGDDGFSGPMPYFEYENGMRFYVADPSGVQISDIEDTYYIDSVKIIGNKSNYTDVINLGMSKDDLNRTLGTQLELWEDGTYDWDTEEFDVTGYYAGLSHEHFYESFSFDLDYKLTSAGVSIN